MELSSLAGNARLKEQLSRQEEGRGLSHAYIISGPAGSGRHTTAKLLAAAMMCTANPGRRPCGGCAACKKVYGGIHPDVVIIAGPEAGKPINVNQIRDLQKDAHVRPNEGERKVYLLEEADRMRDEAQNAMLKLLEDGPKYAVFLLLAENGGGLLQTVRSRCEELTLTTLTPAQCEEWLRGRYPEKRGEELRAAALNCQGLLGRAVEELEGNSTSGTIMEQAARLAQVLETGSELEVFEATMPLEKLGREELNRLLDELTAQLTRRMGGQADRRRLFRAVEVVQQLRGATRFNVSSGQIAGWLCAGLFSAT